MVERNSAKGSPVETVNLTRLRLFIEGTSSETRISRDTRIEAVRDWLAIQWLQSQETISSMLRGEEEKVGVWRQMIKGVSAEMTRRERDDDTGVWYQNAHETFQTDYFPFFLNEAEREVRGIKGRELLTRHERRIWAVDAVFEMYPPIAGRPLKEKGK